MSDEEQNQAETSAEQQFTKLNETVTTIYKYGRFILGLIVLIMSGLGYYFNEKLDQLRVNTNELGEVSESIAGLGEKIQGVSTNLTTMNENITDRIGTLETNQNTAKESLTDIKVDIATLSTVADRVKQSEVAITASAKSVTDLQTKVAESFTSLKTATENLQEEVVTKTDAVNVELASALKTIEGHEQKITELEGVIADKVATTIQAAKQHEKTTENRFVLPTANLQPASKITLRKEKAIDVTNLSSDNQVYVSSIRITIPQEKLPPEEYTLTGTVDKNGTLLIHIANESPAEFVKMLSSVGYIIVYVAFETS